MESVGRSLRDRALAASPQAASSWSGFAGPAPALAFTSSRDSVFCMVMARRNSIVRRSQKWFRSGMDLLQSMPDRNHFWDRLTMEFRRAMTMQKTLSLLLVKAKAGAGPAKPDQDDAAWGDAAKALSRKLRPTDSIYRLGTEILALVLPETDSLTAKRTAVRLQEELQDVRTKYGKAFDISAHNYPQDVQSVHELEDIVKSLLPEQEDWESPVPSNAK